MNDMPFTVFCRRLGANQWTIPVASFKTLAEARQYAAERNSKPFTPFFYFLG